jgi:pimeloyl-ACP methyl ester carboxylesterase
MVDRGAMMERRYVGIGGRQAHVVTAGAGPAVVVLHPLPMWSMTVAPLIEALGSCFHVVAPDLAGYGLSDGLEGDGADAEALGGWGLSPSVTARPSARSWPTP